MLEYRPDRVTVQVVLACRERGLKVGEAISEPLTLFPRWGSNGEVVTFGELVEVAIREAIEAAVAREAG